MHFFREVETEAGDALNRENATQSSDNQPGDFAESDFTPLQTFRPDVQSMRGLAVLAVVLYHSKFLLSGGFIGVDVFFVISGFVIGRLLVKSLLGSNRIGAKSFYGRRVQRILPALCLLVVTVIALSPLLAPIAARQSMVGTGVAASLFNANTYLYATASNGYFGVAATLNPLLHTWSLSVEEQFYFAFPIILLVVWLLAVRVRRSIWLLRGGLVALAVASFALSVYFTGGAEFWVFQGERFAFFSPITRAWEFAIGVILVLVPVRRMRSKISCRIQLTVGISLILIAAIVYTDKTTFPGFAAVIPVLGAALAIHASTSASSRSSSNPVAAAFAWMGTISYSWYLWHWPMIVFVGAFWPTAGNIPLIIAGALSLIPALASYKWIEQRFRRQKFATPARQFSIGIACIAIPIVIALSVVSGLGNAITPTRQIAKYMDAIEPHAGATRDCIKFPSVDAPGSDACTWGSTSRSGRRIMLVGDSNADQFTEALRDGIAGSSDSLKMVNQNACPFVHLTLVRNGVPQDRCTEFVSKSLADMKTSPPDIVIIANSTWGYAHGAKKYAVVDPSDGSVVTGPDQVRVFQSQLEQTIREIQAMGSRVVLIAQAPQFGNYTLGSCSALALWIRGAGCIGGDSFAADSSALLLEGHAIESMAAENTSAALWDFTDSICLEGFCEPLRSDGIVTWRDGSHISVPASESLAPVVRERLRVLTR